MDFFFRILKNGIRMGVFLLDREDRDTNGSFIQDREVWVKNGYFSRIWKIGIKVGLFSQDLEDWVSSAEHGFIFFSLGSAVRPEDIPDQWVHQIKSKYL